MHSEPQTADDMLALLSWYRDMGVSEAVSDQPLDRFALTKAAAQVARPVETVQPAPVPAATVGGAEIVETAREIAAKAGDLDQLRAALEAFNGCPLKLRATQLVFADGDPQADVMLIGEAPGRDEDLEGLPFVGRSGQLLDRILAAIGLDRASVYIANTVPWRPPGNRDPSPAELATCRPFLERQVELVAPRLVVALGGAAMREVMGVSGGILRNRGQWRDILIGSHACAGMATLHPAYLLRQPGQKRLVWQDMLSLKAKLGDQDSA